MASATTFQQQVAASKSRGGGGGGTGNVNDSRDAKFNEAHSHKSGSPGGAPSDADTVYQPAQQSDTMHNKYLEDRRKEQERKNWGPIERLLRSLGWKPKVRESQPTPDSVRAYVEQLERRNKGIIDPRTSTFIGNWDLITLALLLFTVLITPYEVVFLTPSKTVTALFAINRFVDGCFMFDMYVQFNLSYEARVEDGGGWILDRRRIRNHYLSFW